MKYFYLSMLSILLTHSSFSQCPVITQALVNAPGTTEGINEFVVFNTTIADTVGAYQLNYGSNNPPTTSSTGILSGENASAKTGIGNIISTTCTVTEVTNPTTNIPANSTVMFIPASFDQQYNVSSICNGNGIYVVYINTDASPSKWAANGTLANSPTANRYLQIIYKTDSCSNNIQQYFDGWSGNANGNFVSWNLNDTAGIYSNDSSTVVPVRLISFTTSLSGGNAILSWQTASELNTRSFVIERSVDGTHFTAIDTIAINGNSSTIKNYSKTDYAIAQGLSFYRLKIIDVDGTVSYSQINKVINSTSANGLKVYPSITTSQLTIEWNAHNKNNTTIMVVDFLGRVLLSKQLPAAIGNNSYQLNTDNLPKGNYALKLLDNSQPSVAKFSKQ